jgi:hypothetical protein
MELLDVVNDIETPPTSEDEDPESPILHPPRTEHILQLLLNMLAAISTLTRETSYSELYYDQKYLKNVEKKMKKMKEIVKFFFYSDEFIDNFNNFNRLSHIKYKNICWFLNFNT